MKKSDYLIVFEALENLHNKNGLFERDIFKLIENKIIWDDFVKVIDLFEDKEYTDRKNGIVINERGLQAYRELMKESKEENTEKSLTSEKLKLNVRLSKWQVIIFWPVFIIGLFGGIYSGIDFFRKETNEVSKEQLVTKDELQKEIIKLKEFIKVESNLKQSDGSTQINDTITITPANTRYKKLPGQ